MLSITVRCTLAPALLLGLAACAHDPANQTPDGSAADGTRLQEALLQPAADLNLTRAPIPARLLQLDGEYKSRRPPDCDAIVSEVAALTEILGPEPGAADAESVGQQASAAGIDVVAGATGGLIPFRSLVRRATGASAHEKKIRQAYLSGMQRRAYLQGIALALDCQSGQSAP